MQYNVSITKRILLTAIMFIVGLGLTGVGISSYYKYNHALNLNTLDEQMLKDGKYITGNINTYIGGLMYGTNTFYGVSQTHLTFWKTYDYYTVPIEQDSYVVLLISDEAVKEQLAAFENGQGESVYFEGIVIEPPSTINYDWYEKVPDFDSEKVIGSYVIKEATLKNTNIVIWGVLLLFLSILFFFFFGGSNSFISVETDETDYDLYVNTLNKDKE